MIYLDVGNTYTKWEIEHATSKPSAGQFFTAELLISIDKLLNENPKEQAILASWVGTSEIKQQLMPHLVARGISFEVAMSQRSQCGLINAYPQYDRLGVDRWLAMLGLWHQYQRPFCVVDAGTALTMDFVNANGRHLGGYIVPGVRTMITSLNLATAQIECATIQRTDLDWLPGTNTVDAVQRGIVLTLAGSVEYAATRVANQFADNNFTCFMGGGDAELLAPLLDARWHIEKSLVIAGLKVYAGSTGQLDKHD